MMMPDTDLRRPDLQAIGLVLVHLHRRRTDTLWCEPDVDPGPLYEAAATAGQQPAALVLVFGGEVKVYVRPAWQGVRWITSYVERLVKQIAQHGGLAGFLAEETTLVGENEAAAARRN